MKLPTLGRILLSAALIVTASASLHGQPVFRGWVALYEPSQLAWLENENRLNELCRDVSDPGQCRVELLMPQVHVYDLHREPDPASPVAGQLVVVAAPGRGLSAHFRPEGPDQIETFVPDLFLSDWGYGPHFHQTLVEERGSWFALPPGPWDGVVWFERSIDASADAVVGIGVRDIVEFRGEGWFVADTETDALVMRPEQEADMWCQPGDPPPLDPVEPRRFPRSELTDVRGHLTVTFRYPKGC